ncbi:MarR family winged helix-turn-helix transcriptional regulator [Paraoerskovia sediminicola]|nr:MarR family transcriptional regulator [Paraoerskovia sediminicola]
MSTPDGLASSETDIALWFGWKRVHETVRVAVVDEVTAATGLSEPDLTILMALAISGDDGTLRQSVLAVELAWDRTRVSHQVTRMERRGLVERKRVRRAAEVTITEHGLDQVRTARPIHDAAVKRHVLDRLTPEQRIVLRETLAVLGAPPAEA